ADPTSPGSPAPRQIISVKPVVLPAPQRIDDLERVIDQLDTVVAAVPGLAERVDRGADSRPGENATDPRVKAGVLLATTGTGGSDLTAFAQENFAFMSPDFDQLTTPTLVVAGDHDQSLLSTRGPDWFTDVYRQSPGARSLLTVLGGEHSLGGIHAYRSADTTDEDPARVDAVRRITTAFLQQALDVDSSAWDRETAALAASPTPAARLDSK
ncbi:MAG: hypothetical protein ACRYG2_34435, partial [Janthinobacterium lividum]